MKVTCIKKDRDLHKKVDSIVFLMIQCKTDA